MATTVKVCGVKEGNMAYMAWQAGADFVGLVVTESQRRVSLPQVADLTAQLPQIRFVAVGRDVSEELFHQLLDLPLYAIQLHGKSPRDWISRAQQRKKRAIATRLDPQADVVLLDNAEPGSGQVWDWRKPSFVRPIWIAGGLTPQNVGMVVSRIRPNGVDVSSGVEVDGQKNVDLIRLFIEEVHRGDNARS